MAERIRKLILDEPMDGWTELFLYEAARAEHLARTIRPALERGEWVLCDRFTDSTLAYQGMARGLPWKTIRKINEIATQGLKPDLTVWLDADPELGLSRAAQQTRFEAEGLKFQQKVYQGFARAKKEEPKRFLVVEAFSGTPEEMAQKITTQLLKRFASKRRAA